MVRLHRVLIFLSVLCLPLSAQIFNPGASGSASTHRVFVTPACANWAIIKTAGYSTTTCTDHVFANGIAAHSTVDVPDASAATNNVLLNRALPTKPYSYIAQVTCAGCFRGSGQVNDGVCVRNSAAGTWRCVSNIIENPTYTTFFNYNITGDGTSGTGVLGSDNTSRGQIDCFLITDDNTTRQVYFSTDCSSWSTPLVSEATATGTPDSIGITFACQNGSAWHCKFDIWSEEILGSVISLQ